MIESIQKQWTITAAFHNQRLDTVLAQWLPEYSRTQIANWIKKGSVTLNQKTAKPKDKTASGDVIILDVQLQPLDKDFTHCEAEDIPLSIIFEDEDVLIINKPAGLVVHPGAGNRQHTLVNALLHHSPSLHALPRAGIIHRLDKDTTGLLIVAKSMVAQTALVRQMQAREIQRHYITLVYGRVLGGGVIDTGFGRHPRNRLKMSVLPQGRQAITHYAVKDHYKFFTLLDVNLMTGRTHQIRVHLAHINHAVVGDPLYCGRVRFPAKAPVELRAALEHFNRQALHACSLAFTHPINQQALSFKAPIPEDFHNLLTLLDEYDADSSC